jgi:hypothetical protein
MRTHISRLAVVPLALTLSACSINVDSQGHIERDDKRFTVEGTPDLDLSTFDGAIEVRGWDRNEVTVTIEKRAQEKEDLARIVVTTEQKGSRITVDARSPGSGTYVGIGVFISPMAKIIVNAPRSSNVTARSGDGSITLDRITGKLEVKTSDGSIKAIETGGELLAETGDGSLTLEDVTGRIEARTDDGSVRISGVPSVVRVRSGDGSVVLRVRRGATMTEDWLVTTRDGSIVAELPDDFSCSIEAEPGDGDRARSELTLVGQEGGTRDQRVLRGQLGNGGKQLVLRTSDGSIRLTNY